jgi:hypothetical protein
MAFNNGIFITKYESQLFTLFPLYGKIKNLPSHQPVKLVNKNGEKNPPYFLIAKGYVGLDESTMFGHGHHGFGGILELVLGHWVLTSAARRVVRMFSKRKKKDEKR